MAMVMATIKGGPKRGPQRHTVVEAVHSAFLPKTRTFEAFTQNGKRASARPSAIKRAQSARSGWWRDRKTIAVLGGIALGLAGAFYIGASAPKAPWAFDRPAAQLPSLQARHTLY